MTAQHLRDLDPNWRYATLVVVVLDTRTTLIDEIIDLHDRFMGSLFSKAKRNHADRFRQSGKAINDKARKVPDDAPTSFVRKRWESLVRTSDGLDRRFYELCVLAELKNSLRSGDI